MVDETPKRMCPVDRISDLPESIISDILSSIPTKDAVATSILSRSWRFRWTRTTSFNFERLKNEFLIDDAPPTLDFSDFVNMVLLNHSGESINKFVLRWESPHFRPAYLNMWANIAVARNVRVLDLYTEPRWTSRGPGEFHLPFSLYTSGTLEILKLKGPFRVKPPNVVFLPNLAEMEMSAVIYESDESLPILISGCPFLESLTIERTRSGRDNMVVCSISSHALKRLAINFRGRLQYEDAVRMELEIDAPALEYLNLHDYMSSHISIQPRLSSVNKMRLDVMCSDHNMIVGYLQALDTVKTLSLGLNWHAGLANFCVSFEGVVKYFSSMRLPWSSIVDVLDTCIRLEELEIWCVCLIDVPVGCVTRRSSLSSLRCLTLRNFSGFEEEMRMLKFFLDQGSVMEIVNLSSLAYRPTVGKAKKVKILREVSKWFIASPTCKISWHEFSQPAGSCFDQ